jgi:hypothetical protein
MNKMEFLLYQHIIYFTFMIKGNKSQYFLKILKLLYSLFLMKKLTFILAIEMSI